MILGTEPTSGLIWLAFQAESLLFIQKGEPSTPYHIQNSFNSDKPFNGELWNGRNSANNVSTSTALSLRSSKRQSRLPTVLNIHTLNATTTVSSALSLSCLMLYVCPSFCEVCFYRSHFTPKCPLIAQNVFTELATIWSKIMQKRSGKKPPSNRGHSNYRCNRFGSRQGMSYSSVRNINVSQMQQNKIATQKD